MNIDVDWMDPDFIKSMPIMPNDQTCNPVFLDMQLSHASSAELLAATAKDLRGRGWLAIYARMVGQYSYQTGAGMLTNNVGERLLSCVRKILASSKVAFWCRLRLREHTAQRRLWRTHVSMTRSFSDWAYREPATVSRSCLPAPG